MKIQIIQGTHFRVPGTVMLAARGLAKAKEEALGLVNILRAEVGLQPLSDPERFEDGLAEAQKERAAALGCHINDVENCDADVWITELELLGNAEDSHI